jgi:8-oxo-dGTP diphosphatase
VAQERNIRNVAENNMNKITGATFIIMRDSKEMLMQLRDNNSKRYPNTWCFPGGTIEPEENEIKTVIREIKEEYELDIKENDCTELMIYDLSYGVSAKVFICKCDGNQNPVLHEGADMKWVNLKEIQNMQLGFEQEKIMPALENYLQM